MAEKIEDVYRELQLHLDKYPIGFPATKSGAEIRLLKHLFDPKEAKLAIKLSDSYESLDTIYERVKNTGISIDDLKKMLDTMVKNGSIHYKLVNGERHYANAYLVIGMYEYQVNKLTKEFLEDMWQYLNEAFGLELFGTGITQFRTVPVEQSVTPEHRLPTYEELRKIIENIEGPLVVTNCLCRQAQVIVGESCKVTSRQETCMVFGDMAQIYIDEGWGRAISKGEALEVLRKNEEEGLILQAENIQKPEFICSCCGCCCGVLISLKPFPRPVQFFSTNYYALVDPELCIGCETCIERCQMDAIKLVKEKSKVNLKRCIGCGNCIAICPQEAIQLIKKEKVEVPAETEEELFANILARKNELRGKKF